MAWLGYSKNEPYDLEIDSLKFSLKEESYILENMGLYKLISLLTNFNLQRGTHVFRTYSLNELNKWFLFCWNELILFLQKNNYTNSYGSISLNSNSQVEFILNGTPLTINPSSISSELDFNNSVNSKYRGKLFSKFINEHLEGTKNYSDLKSLCVKTAGQNLVAFITSNLTIQNLPRFLQIYPSKYYYGKSTSNSTELYEVPSLNNFSHLFKIKEIRWEGTTQLNIITVLENKQNNHILELRNECRYSHGQLNGTPEAKLYIGRNSSLASIYNVI